MSKSYMAVVHTDLVWYNDLEHTVDSRLIALKKAKAVPLHATKALGGERRYSSYSCSTSALDGGEWSASRPGHSLAPEKGPPVTHWTGGWVGPTAGLDTEARGNILSPLPGIEPRSSGHPARSQTLYWLSYPVHILLPYRRIFAMYGLFNDAVSSSDYLCRMTNEYSIRKDVDGSGRGLMHSKHSTVRRLLG
jgi:hypothetical protein